jgi:CheY-like chemotaxis protein
VEVQSEPGLGSCFRVYLPEQAAQLTPAASESPQQAPSGGHEVILLVEDENILRTLVQRMLEETGYQVVTAFNGPDALEKLYSCGLPIDLLLTDVVMPGGMNGAELAMDLLALQPALKVLYMSGYTSSVFDNKIYSNMRVELLQKPFSRVDLIQAVRRVLDS